MQLNHSIHMVLALGFLAGCAGSTSPYEKPTSNHVGLGTTATMAATTAGGAVLGSSLMSNKAEGAAIGAVGGLVAGAITTNALSSHEQSVVNEAYERGKREARVEVMSQYWKEKTQTPDGEENRQSHEKAIEYPAGTYEGLKFGTRTSTQPTLLDPKR